MGDLLWCPTCKAFNAECEHEQKPAGWVLDDLTYDKDSKKIEE